MTAGGNIEAAFPLTPLQEGMLYESLRRPGSEVYQGRCTALLEGPLDLDCFRRAWALAAQRHESFRTFFAWENRADPVQVVRSRVELDLPLEDWSTLSADEQSRRWEALLEWSVEWSIAMDRAPMMRFRVIRQTPERHRLLWGIHHAVLDGWSGFLILREVMEDYRTLLSGGVVERPAPPSYARFVAWSASRSDGAAEHYWRAALAGFTDPTPLPIRAPVSGWEGRATETLVLSAEESDALRDRARALRVTLNTLVVGAWAVLLARHTRTTDVVFGVTVSERPPEIPGVDRAAGLYLNTIPVRVSVPDADEMNLGPWLADLQRRLSEGREHSAPGLAEIRRWSEVRARGLFESLVVFESFPPEIRSPGAGGRVEIAEATITGPSDLPLALLAFPGETLELHLVRDTQRVDEARGRALLRQVRALLGGMVAEEDSAPRRLPLLSKPERREMLEVRSTTPPPADAWPDVWTRIREVADARGDAVALQAPDGVHAYAELIDAVAASARALRERMGAGPGLVAVRGARSRAFVVGVLAALSEGVPYVVLDPDEPETRSRARMRHVRAVGSEGGWTACDPQSPLADPTLLEGAAYVVYTSGSTGAPKGVVVGRRELAYSTGVREAVYGAGPESFLLLSPLSVDSSVAGLYWTLTTGGRLVLPPVRIEQDPSAFARLLRDGGVTHTLLVPSLHATLLDVLEPRDWANLRVVIVAGEACPPQVPVLHSHLLPAVALYNEYGPSEATVWTTVARLDGQQEVTIGHPIPGAWAHVRDEQGALVPDDMIGELYIGGPGVARGYLDDAAATATRFMQDPHGGGRLYRTGDLVYRTADGSLQFVGRADAQVKVRGHRIELEEIERALRFHPGVLDAAVALRTVSADDSSASLTERLARLPGPVAERLLRSVEEA